jgi:hypothetical protein
VLASGHQYYLFPVQALSRCYRGKMVSALRAAWKHGDLPRVASAGEVSQRLQRVMQTEWVVYTKACHKTEEVLDYLSRYTHKIALSESRILQTDPENVHLRWKDYRDNLLKVMALDGVEFLRRFSACLAPRLHANPPFWLLVEPLPPGEHRENTGGTTCPGETRKGGRSDFDGTALDLPGVQNQGRPQGGLAQTRRCAARIVIPNDGNGGRVRLFWNTPPVCMDPYALSPFNIN